MLKTILIFYLSVVVYADEIQFDCSIRIIRGDNFRPPLSNEATALFRIKADHYRRLVIVHNFCLNDLYITNSFLIIRFIGFIKLVVSPMLFDAVQLIALPMAVWLFFSSCFLTVVRFPREYYLSQFFACRKQLNMI